MWKPVVAFSALLAGSAVQAEEAPRVDDSGVANGHGRDLQGLPYRAAYYKPATEEPHSHTEDAMDMEMEETDSGNTGELENGDIMMVADENGGMAADEEDDMGANEEDDMGANEEEDMAADEEDDMAADEEEDMAADEEDDMAADEEDDIVMEETEEPKMHEPEMKTYSEPVHVVKKPVFSKKGYVVGYTKHKQFIPKFHYKPETDVVDAGYIPEEVEDVMIVEVDEPEHVHVPKHEMYIATEETAGETEEIADETEETADETEETADETEEHKMHMHEPKTYSEPVHVVKKPVFSKKGYVVGYTKHRQFLPKFHYKPATDAGDAGYIPEEEDEVVLVEVDESEPEHVHVPKYYTTGGDVDTEDSTGSEDPIEMEEPKMHDPEMKSYGEPVHVVKKPVFSSKGRVAGFTKHRQYFKRFHH